MSDWYRLEGRNAVRCEGGIYETAALYEARQSAMAETGVDPWCVARHEVAPGVDVSTVFS